MLYTYQKHICACMKVNVKLWISQIFWMHNTYLWCKRTSLHAKCSVVQVFAGEVSVYACEVCVHVCMHVLYAWSTHTKVFANDASGLCIIVCMRVRIYVCVCTHEDIFKWYMFHVLIFYKAYTHACSIQSCMQTGRPCMWTALAVGTHTQNEGIHWKVSTRMIFKDDRMHYYVYACVYMYQYVHRRVICIRAWLPGSVHCVCVRVWLFTLHTSLKKNDTIIHFRSNKKSICLTYVRPFTLILSLLFSRTYPKMGQLPRPICMHDDWIGLLEHTRCSYLVYTHRRVGKKLEQNILNRTIDPSLHNWCYSLLTKEVEQLRKHGFSFLISGEHWYVIQEWALSSQAKMQRLSAASFVVLLLLLLMLCFTAKWRESMNLCDELILMMYRESMNLCDEVILMMYNRKSKRDNHCIFMSWWTR